MEFMSTIASDRRLKGTSLSAAGDSAAGVAAAVQPSPFGSAGRSGSRQAVADVVTEPVRVADNLPPDVASAKRMGRLAPKQSTIGGRGAVSWSTADGSGAPLPAVGRLLKRYGIRADVGRPIERVLTWVTGLDRVLAAAPGDDRLIDHLLAKDVDARRYLFMVEGLLRLYRHHYGESFDRQLDAVKELEDAFGAVDCTGTMLAEARRVELPKKAIRLLKDEDAQARKKLGKLLRKHWLPQEKRRCPGVAALLHALTGVVWDDTRADRAFLTTELSRRLTKVADNRYDMAEVETGIHELRRQLRWFPIYFSALEGMAKLCDDRHPIPAYAALLNDSAATSKFAQLAPSERESEPWSISRSLYVANTLFIAELGRIKDDLLVIETMTRALHEAGCSDDEGTALHAALGYLGKTPADLKRLHGRAAEIYAEVRQNELLEHWQRELLTA
jgi:hypothetical protein